MTKDNDLLVSENVKGGVPQTKREIPVFCIGDRVVEKAKAEKSAMIGAGNRANKWRKGSVEKIDESSRDFRYLIRFDDGGLKWCDGRGISALNAYHF